MQKLCELIKLFHSILKSLKSIGYWYLCYKCLPSEFNVCSNTSLFFGATLDH